MTLTGKRRHRVQMQRVWLFWKRPLLVLQVEEKCLHISYPGGYAEAEQTTWWRDATVEDFGDTLGVS